MIYDDHFFLIKLPKLLKMDHSEKKLIHELAKPANEMNKEFILNALSQDWSKSEIGSFVVETLVDLSLKNMCPLTLSDIIIQINSNATLWPLMYQINFSNYSQTLTPHAQQILLEFEMYKC